MLVSMGQAVKEHGADLCVGFDGDGDRCGVAGQDEGEEIFADKMAACCWRATCRNYRPPARRSWSM